MVRGGSCPTPRFLTKVQTWQSLYQRVQGRRRPVRGDCQGNGTSERKLKEGDADVPALSCHGSSVSGLLVQGPGTPGLGKPTCTLGSGLGTMVSLGEHVPTAGGAGLVTRAESAKPPAAPGPCGYVDKVGVLWKVPSRGDLVIHSYLGRSRPRYTASL